MYGKNTPRHTNVVDELGENYAEKDVSGESLKNGPKAKQGIVACQENGKIVDKHSDVYS